MRALGAEIDTIPSLEGRPKVTAKDIDTCRARQGARERARPLRDDQFNNPYIIPDHRTGLGARSGSRPQAA